MKRVLLGLAIAFALAGGFAACLFLSSTAVFAQDAGIASNAIVAAVCDNGGSRLYFWLTLFFGTSVGCSLLSNWARIHSIPFAGAIVRLVGGNFADWIQRAALKAAKTSGVFLAVIFAAAMLAACSSAPSSPAAASASSTPSAVASSPTGQSISSNLGALSGAVQKATADVQAGVATANEYKPYLCAAIAWSDAGYKLAQGFDAPSQADNDNEALAMNAANKLCAADTSNVPGTAAALVSIAKTVQVATASSATGAAIIAQAKAQASAPAVAAPPTPASSNPVPPATAPPAVPASSSSS